MQTWYKINKPRKISNKTDASADVYILDEIGGFGVSAKDFINELKPFADKTLNLHINSRGGDVFEGLMIFNYLRSSKKTLNVYVDGLAASIASIIAMAGDTISMADNAYMMIHNPWMITMGDSEELRKTADTLDKIKEGLLNTYVDKTKLSSEKINAMMDEETWLTAKEAKDLGFISDIHNSLKAAACFKPNQFGFKNIPLTLIAGDTSTTRSEVATMPVNPAEESLKPSPTMNLSEFKDNYKNLYDEVFNLGVLEGKQSELLRIKEVENQLIDGHEALINSLKFDGVTTGAQAAIKVLAAEKQLKSAAFEKGKSEAPAPLPSNVEVVVSAPKNLTFEEKCKFDWDTNAAIREEFYNYESYEAYIRAENNGQVKILTKRGD